VRRLVAAVLAAGSALAACSGTPAPEADDLPENRTSVVAARVLVDDPAFDPSVARRPRFVPCVGLSGCARSTEREGDFYPGADISDSADAEVDHTAELVLYLVAARFDRADLEGNVLHVKVVERPAGFQMVELDGREVLALPSVVYSFEEGSRAICAGSLEGCG
jgi:hypothetical protein